MASAIEDVNELLGESVKDQDGRQIGKVKEIYTVGDENAPMWVTVELSTGIGRSKLVFVPIARLKEEGGEIRVPYSFRHVQESPDVEAADKLSAEDDQALRNYYAIGLGDQEMRANSDSYASLVPDGDGPATKADGEVGEPQSGKIEGEDRDVELKNPRKDEDDGEDHEEDSDTKIEDPRKREA
jgi:sporulation protein YlmC with PRC-barrel domain